MKDFEELKKEAYDGMLSDLKTELEKKNVEYDCAVKTRIREYMLEKLELAMNKRYQINDDKINESYELESTIKGEITSLERKIVYLTSRERSFLEL